MTNPPRDVPAASCDWHHLHIAYVGAYTFQYFQPNRCLASDVNVGEDAAQKCRQCLNTGTCPCSPHCQASCRLAQMSPVSALRLLHVEMPAMHGKDGIAMENGRSQMPRSLSAEWECVCTMITNQLCMSVPCRSAGHSRTCGMHSPHLGPTLGTTYSEH